MLFKINKNFQNGDVLILDGKRYIAIRNTKNNKLLKENEFNIGKNKDITALNLFNTIKRDDNYTSIDFDLSKVEKNNLKLVRMMGIYQDSPFDIKFESNKLNLKLQTGANKNQSFNIELCDMGANSLGISNLSIKDTNSIKFTQTHTKNLNKRIINNTNRKIKEYALDVSSHEKCTAAIEDFDKQECVKNFV